MEWMTKKDLAEYIQISESKINLLVQNKKIPFHNNHGFLRFNKAEIDKWMKSPADENEKESNEMASDFVYRGIPITKYTLSSSRILSGEKVWERFQEFICKAIDKINSLNDQNYLYRDDFKDFIKNFSDYLGLSCQLGFFESEKGEGKIKHYYPTESSRKIYTSLNLVDTKKIILNNIIDLVSESNESHPNERHAIYLLWYYLSLKNSGLEPEPYHFQRTETESKNYYPNVRLSFAKSFCEFLFGGDENKEHDFLEIWNSRLA